jgi:hypothetical protein
VSGTIYSRFDVCGIFFAFFYSIRKSAQEQARDIFVESYFGLDRLRMGRLACVVSGKVGI